MTQLLEIIVTLILVGVVLGGIYTFMGDIFTASQIANVQSNFTGVNSTVMTMIDTASDIKNSTEYLEPTGLGTGFISTTINGMIIAGKAVVSSIDSVGDLVSSMFRAFGISTGDGSVIYWGLISVFIIIIVFSIYEAIKGGAT
jgi:hypothetical protein